MRRKMLFIESSFNMTKGGGGDEDIEGRLRKFLDTRKGGLQKFVYFKINRSGGAPKN